MCVYLPTLPLYAQSMTGNLALVGIALSMFGLWQIVIRLPLGVATDRSGWSKPYIIGGFAVAAIGTWMMGQADGVAALMIGRSLTGMAAGVFGLLVVVFSGLFLAQESVQASTILIVVASLGTLTATSMTGFLNQLGGYSLSFYVAAGAAVLAIVLLLPAHERRRQPHPVSASSVGKLVTRRDVLIPSLLGAAIQYAATATTFGFLPILANQMGAGDVMISILTSTEVAFVAVGSLLARYATRRIRDWTLVSLSLVMLSAGVGLAALAPALSMLFAVQCLIGLSWGICYPVITGMSIKQVEDVGRNTAMGAFQTGCSIGVFGGSWVSGVLANMMGIRPMFGVTAFGLSALAVLLIRKPGLRS